MDESQDEHFQILTERLKHYEQKASQGVQLSAEGRLTRMVGQALEAEGCRATIGSRCIVINHQNEKTLAEVVGFAGDKLYLMPLEQTNSIGPGARVIPIPNKLSVPVGEHLLGRILDGAGNPIDGFGALEIHQHVSLDGPKLNPLMRQPITTPLDVGVRAINSMLPIGQGQRIGVFASSGVGKSVLLGMMTRYSTADVVVVALIGERGREVLEFIEKQLGPEGLRKAVVITAPADSSPLSRLQGSIMATRIAEYFRDEGKQVLLIMDSLTRFAQAQREIGLAIGELPVSRGYPSSVFYKIPQLIERAGNATKGQGTLTAFYTILTESFEQDDPIAESARAILDGHIVLSRELADKGQYPAIDIERSISRVAEQIIQPDHRVDIAMFKKLYSSYMSNLDLISVGAYQKGADETVDRAIELMPIMQGFLSQMMDESISFADSVAQLHTVLRHQIEPGN